VQNHINCYPVNSDKKDIIAVPDALRLNNENKH